MIPEDKKTAVAQALQCTFGVSEFESITPLTAGLSSALIFKIVVLGKPYLLRIITRTDVMSDPTRWYACMKDAADAGIAPRAWYMGGDDRISITDFIEAKPFPLSEARVLLPEMVKRLQALPRFPFRLNYLDAVDGFVQKFREAKILPESMTDELFRCYAKMMSIYSRHDADQVSCHNDLKPENILFDGTRAWFVDWEAAFLNDRYMDIVVTANFVVDNYEQETEYLKRYLGEEVTEYHHARFFLMSQVLHMAYFTFFMRIYAATGKPVDIDAARPDYRAFHNDIWDGKIDLADDDARQQYAWLHMERMARNFQIKRFEDSMAELLRS